jgi:hypothetical protein
VSYFEEQGCTIHKFTAGQTEHWVCGAL